MSDAIEIRPELLEFARAIEKTLRRNDWKRPQWQEMRVWVLSGLLGEEELELLKAVRSQDPNAICAEIQNVAAIYMMLWHKYKEGEGNANP